MGERAGRVNSVIVYGRPGCGKTSNAEKMRVAMGLDEIVDDWEPLSRSSADLPHFGALILTSVLPSKDCPALRAKGWNVMSFEEAMRTSGVGWSPPEEKPLVGVKRERERPLTGHERADAVADNLGMLLGDFELRVRRDEANRINAARGHREGPDADEGDVGALKAILERFAAQDRAIENAMALLSGVRRTLDLDVDAGTGTLGHQFGPILEPPKPYARLFDLQQLPAEAEKRMLELRALRVGQRSARDRDAKPGNEPIAYQFEGIQAGKATLFYAQSIDEARAHAVAHRIDELRQSGYVRERAGGGHELVISAENRVVPVAVTFVRVGETVIATSK